MYYIGIFVVTASVLGGYLIVGGHLDVLWQPAEYLIILGAGLGAFFAGNRKHNLTHSMALMNRALSEKNYGKAEYNDLLCVMYSIFKIAKTKSMIAIEPHIEKPETSDIFQKYSSFLKNHHALNLFCDYIRMVSMGIEDPFIIDDLMREEIDTLKHENLEAASMIQTLADSFPAIGIVAAVLGVIKTMGSIDQPPEVLGHLIGGALVGTFLGILVAYGFVAPIATRMKQVITLDNQYFDCVKAGIVAYLNNLPPIIAVETARKSIDPEFRPSYSEMEEKVNNTGL